MTQIPRLHLITTERERRMEALLTRMVECLDGNDDHLRLIAQMVDESAREFVESECSCGDCESCPQDDAETRYVDSLDAAELEAMPDIYDTQELPR